MSTIPSKQIIKFLAGVVGISGISATGTSTNITTNLTSALSTAGAGGVSVPVQPSTSDGLGVITTGATNRVEVNEGNLKDNTGKEVYGRLTHASGVYTLSYFVFDGTTETAFSFANATTLRIDVPYRFDFNRLPTDSSISTSYRVVNSSAMQAGQKVYVESLTATATNSTLTLAKTPDVATNVKLSVNGVGYISPFNFAINTATRVITWNPTNSGFDITTTDRIYADYTSLE